MESEKIEEKLKIESSITELKRQYKITHGQLEDLKSEYQNIADALGKNKALLEESKVNLTKVNNEISDARLEWMKEKDAEWQKVNAKLAEAENIIKRKQELNDQEQKLRDIEQVTTDKLNEQRQLELKNNQEIKLLEAEKRQHEDNKKKVVAYGKKVEKDKEQFKEELSNFIKQWQTKF